MAADPWLDRWMPLMQRRAKDLLVLELGCGSGRDATVLAEAGFRVVALDASAKSIAKARGKSLSAEFHCQDMRDPFPASVRTVGAVLASLSLHYFDWPDLSRMVARVHAVLEPNGLFLCRVNSTNDNNYGASGHPEISDHFYLVDGRRKRFFDRKDIDRLFAGAWNRIGCEERTIDRYDLAKSVWEIVLEKAAASPIARFS